MSSTATVNGAKPRPAKAAAAVAPPNISDRTLKHLTDFFKMLADKSRLRIVMALAKEGELHVSALCGVLGGQSQPAVSHHLTLMRGVGLVDFRRRGKHNYYHLESGHVRDLIEQFFTDSGNGPRQLQFEEFSLTFKRRP